MLGRMIFNKTIYDVMKPECLDAIKAWMDRGTVVKQDVKEIIGEQGIDHSEYVYLLDHPDFVQADPIYDYTLHFKRLYEMVDGEYREHDVIAKLSYWSKDYKVRDAVVYYA